jgi:metal-responsive CopG/Arc/MetJ family transcriptional regulator
MPPVKIGISLPANLLAFADEEAQRRGTTRSGLLARLLEAEQVQAQVRRYIDQHGWDVADDEGHWRQYQQARMAEEYRDDDW